MAEGGRGGGGGGGARDPVCGVWRGFEDIRPHLNTSPLPVIQTDPAARECVLVMHEFSCTHAHPACATGEVRACGFVSAHMCACVCACVQSSLPPCPSPSPPIPLAWIGRTSVHSSAGASAHPRSRDRRRRATCHARKRVVLGCNSMLYCVASAHPHSRDRAPCGRFFGLAAPVFALVRHCTAANESSGAELGGRSPDPGADVGREG